MKIIPFLSVLKSIFIPVSFKLSFSKQIFLKAKNPFSPLCRFFCTNMIFPVFQKDHIIRYGYYRYEKPLMYICIILLVIITQIVQEAGLRISVKSDKRLH